MSSSSVWSTEPDSGLPGLDRETLSCKTENQPNKNPLRDGHSMFEELTKAGRTKPRIFKPKTIY